MKNLPIYRAKKIDSDEYIEGMLIEDYEIGTYIQVEKSLELISNDFEYGYLTDNFIQVDRNTLSIHFIDMIASDSNRLLPNGEKDLRIFASLSEDGKGGDMLDDGVFKKVCKYDKIKGVLGFIINTSNKKIIGIKE